PCGFLGDGRRAGRCPPTRALAYRQRLSGPLLDRIDIQIDVPRLTRAELVGSRPCHSSAAARERVGRARERQRTRLAGTPWDCNGQVPGSVARRLAGMTSEAERVLAG